MGQESDYSSSSNLFPLMAADPGDHAIPPSSPATFSVS